MLDVVLMSHGDMARGVKSSLEMLAGKQEHVYTVSLPEGGDDLQFENELKALMATLPGEVLLIADLLGGTPCNVALRNYGENENVSIIAGLSLPLALEAVLEPDKPVNELVKSARNSTVDVKNQFKETKENTVATATMDPTFYAQYAGKANIVNARIDERLIHGQVAGIWSSTLKTQRIIVANDDAAADTIQKSALRMAAPPSMRLSVLPVETAAENIQAGKYGEQRIFLIFKNPSDVERYLKSGGKLEAVTVGNMSFKDGAREVTRSIQVTTQDENAFNEINAEGVIITSQMVPDDTAIDFMKKLNEK